jgi:homoserine O-acetyltransferase
MTDETSIGIVEPQFFTFADPPNEMELDCGLKLGPITLCYETYGELNQDKSNAVLVLHALSGDAHAAGLHSPGDRKPGWWDMMIGPGKGIDTNKYFVISSNVLGGCQGSTGPQSVNPETGQEYGLTFPIITIGDMVRAQKFLVEHFGIEKILSVIGGSMGGMQALEWYSRYPDMITSALVIASTPLLGAQAIAFDAVGRHAIQADTHFHNGHYYEQEERPETGLAIARMLGHITYLSDDSMRMKFGRALRNTDTYTYDFKSEFSVETYLDYQGEQFVNRFDANSYMYITKAIDYFDLAANHGSLDNALGNRSGKLMVISFTSDWLYPPYQSRLLVDAMLRQKSEVTFCNVESDFGHDAFLLEEGIMTKVVSGFVDHAAAPDAVRSGMQVEVDSEAELGPPPSASHSIYEGHRIDYDMICDLVDEGSRVLDIGCGDGELSHRLIAQRDVQVMGIEKAQGNIISCVRRGIPVVQMDADDGLTHLPDQSYDYVILSMTLQVIRKPEFVLGEMLRVGKKCIVSFPNFGYWKIRLKTLLLGKAPVTRNLPYAWFASPNRHVLSIQDFRNYCSSRNIRIVKEVALPTYAAKVWPNMLADEAVFVITAR